MPIRVFEGKVGFLKGVFKERDSMGLFCEGMKFLISLKKKFFLIKNCQK